ncbi:endonuclease domain-containing protein [Patescibacteria group bacterium]|nr:endonuclease domain-containing protein [Patescibacteria group bacterium]MBU4016647.1 endonuclease domain-containing protein [Patescibacteria group bacterium]MBU4099285.1 endonuclease domain-containing protein [Patescibacteria group bacterium]
MTIYYNPKLKNYSRKLRSQMTDAELKFWSIARKRQIENIQFLRQRPIGKYIVDFVSLSHKIIIEIDGSQHYEENHKIKDQQRDLLLNKLGYIIVRFNDNEVLSNIEGVREELYRKIKSLPASL